MKYFSCSFYGMDDAARVFEWISSSKWSSDLMSVGKEIGCTWNFSHHLLVGHLFIADEKSLPEFVTSKEFFYRKVRFWWRRFFVMPSVKGSRGRAANSWPYPYRSVGSSFIYFYQENDWGGHENHIMWDRIHTQEETKDRASNKQLILLCSTT
jgi:hypothetical protein